jgi:hypothetical protein
MALRRQSRKRLLDPQPDPVETAVDGDGIVRQGGRSAPDSAGDRELAERSLIAQRIAVLELNHGIVERSTAIQLDEARLAPELVVAVTACAGECHLVFGSRNLQRLARGSVDCAHVQRLIHRIACRHMPETMEWAAAAAARGGQ